MIGGVKNLKISTWAITVLFLLCFFLMPSKIFAAKQITLTPSSNQIEIGKTFEVKVDINTDGEKVNAVSFKIDFSTEMLDGQLPSQANSNFPFCAVLTSTKISCGAPVAGGVAVNGLVTTLVFKAKHEGNISVNATDFEIQQVHEEQVDGKTKPVVNNLAGFTSNTVEMSIFAQGARPQAQATTNKAPSTSQTVQVPASVTPPGLAAGSIPQVIGPTGSTPEEILKKQTEGDGNQNGEVKGSFMKSPVNISYITNFLMLLAVGFLMFKLFFTEKRRHLEMERIFEQQIGTLSALESKIDIFDQKAEGAKEKIIKEFEEAKNQLFGKDDKGDKTKTGV